MILYLMSQNTFKTSETRINVKLKDEINLVLFLLSKPKQIFKLVL